MEQTSDRSSDLWAGLALAALGAYIVVQAARWDYMGPDGPGPGFFPLWYGIAIVLLSLALVAGGVRARLRRAAAETVPWARFARALAVWAAFAVSVTLFNVLGFTVSFALLCFFVVAAMYRRPLEVAAAVAVASAAGFWLVFPFALGVALPVGLLGF